MKKYSFLIVLVAGAAIVAYGFWIFPPIYRFIQSVRDRDLTQDFLAIHAAQKGMSPYDRIPQIAARYYGRTYLEEFNHPTPHSPFLLLALSTLSQQTESEFHQDYFYMSVGFIVLTCLATCYALRNRGVSVTGALVIALTAIVSHSALQDLQWGQHNSWFLIFITALWLTFRRNNFKIFGFILGAALALRGFGIPFLISLLIGRRSKPISIALATFVVFSLAALLIMPLSEIVLYFARAVPEAVGCWQGHAVNVSLLTLPQKLLGHSLVSIGRAQPVCVAGTGEISPLWGIALVFLIAIRVCHRTQKASPDSRFSYLLLLSIYSLPLTWPHYFLLLTPLSILAVIELKNAWLHSAAMTSGRALTLILYVALSFGYLSQIWYHLAVASLGVGTHQMPQWMLLLSTAPTVIGVGVVMFGTPDLFPSRIEMSEPVQ